METEEISKRGFFWAGEEPIPTGHAAPENAVPGTLKISPERGPTLDLDGPIPWQDETVRGTEFPWKNA
jgi:hypothetical protein